MKVGSNGSRGMNGTVSERWRALTPAERDDCQQEANRMQVAREELASQPLKQNEEHPCLRKSQLKRLYNTRLDTSLRAVSQHAVWKAGLQLRDHVSALKAEHVWGDAEEKVITQKYREIFAYDATVEPNADLPRYQQPCSSTAGGICRQHEHFQTVEDMVRQLDAGMSAHKLRNETALVCVVCSFGSRWMLVGCVGLRPLVQTVLCLQPVAAQTLSITVEQTRPKIATTHRLFFALLQQHLSSGAARSEFVAEAGFVRSLAFLRLARAGV